MPLVVSLRPFGILHIPRSTLATLAHLPAAVGAVLSAGGWDPSAMAANLPGVLAGLGDAPEDPEAPETPPGPVLVYSRPEAPEAPAPAPEAPAPAPEAPACFVCGAPAVFRYYTAGSGAPWLRCRACPPPRSWVRLAHVLPMAPEAPAPGPEAPAPRAYVPHAGRVFSGAPRCERCGGDRGVWRFSFGWPSPQVVLCEGCRPAAHAEVDRPPLCPVCDGPVLPTDAPAVRGHVTYRCDPCGVTLHTLARRPRPGEEPAP